MAFYTTVPTAQRRWPAEVEAVAAAMRIVGNERRKIRSHRLRGSRIAIDLSIGFTFYQRR